MAAKLGNLRVFYVKKKVDIQYSSSRTPKCFPLELSRIKPSGQINYPHNPPLA